MRHRFGCVLVSAWLLLVQALLGGCTGRADAVRAAQPYVEHFGELRSRALKLLELRTDVARKRMLVSAMNGDERTLPENLKPLLERLRRSGTVITEEQLERGEEMFWRMFDLAFSQDPNVLQAEILFIERDGSVSSLRYPRDRDVPVGVDWHGLRQHRTFAGLTSCRTDEGSEPCVMLQLRPRSHPGSAGLTVAYRRTPLEVTDGAAADR